LHDCHAEVGITGIIAEKLPNISGNSLEMVVYQQNKQLVFFYKVTRHFYLFFMSRNN